MHINLKNNPTRFQPDLIWNNGALGFFEESHPNKNKNKNNKTSSDMRQKNEFSLTALTAVLNTVGCLWQGAFRLQKSCYNDAQKFILWRQAWPALVPEK